MYSRHELKKSEQESSNSADGDLKRRSSAAQRGTGGGVCLTSAGCFSLRWLRSLASAPHTTRRRFRLVDLTISANEYYPSLKARVAITSVVRYGRAGGREAQNSQLRVSKNPARKFGSWFRENTFPETLPSSLKVVESRRHKIRMFNSSFLAKVLRSSIL